uniref:Uncharacterized protein n=1 Tax=Schistosoma curassoni TaxID=6186 RepID=A0A183KT37_9TREM
MLTFMKLRILTSSEKKGGCIKGRLREEEEEVSSDKCVGLVPTVVVIPALLFDNVHLQSHYATD